MTYRTTRRPDIRSAPPHPAATRSRPTRALLILSLALAAAGCSRPINRTAERRIRDALPNVLGSAQGYRVHVDSAPGNTVEGRLAHVTIDGDNVELTNGLLVDALHLDLRDIDYDIRHSAIRSVGAVGFTATFGEAALDEYIAGESPPEDPIRKQHVTIGRGTVTLSAERIVLGVGVPFRVTGPLRIVNPVRVELDPTRLSVIGISISGRALQYLKRKIESGIDLSQLPFPVLLSAVDEVPGKLTVSGTADLAAYLHSVQAHEK